VTCQLTPYLAVRDARAAIAWYGEAFAARLVGEAVVMDDDRIGHAELDVGGARVYLADEYPELGLAPPGDTRSVTLHLVVPDADAAVLRAVEAGAAVERPPADSPHGRTGVVLDPFGHRWMLQTVAHDGSASPGTAPRPGDTVYLTLRVPDGARARDFYEAVLGWSMVPGRVEDGFQESSTTPMVGIQGAQGDDLGAVPMYAVDDIEVAVAAVRTAGGQAEDVEQQSFGRSALCRDDQGLPFWVAQLD
jgi:uncharacterized glyoxalase superfamily protein PhnB